MRAISRWEVQGEGRDGLMMRKVRSVEERVLRCFFWRCEGLRKCDVNSIRVIVAGLLDIKNTPLYHEFENLD